MVLLEENMERFLREEGSRRAFLRRGSLFLTSFGICSGSFDLLTKKAWAKGGTPSLREAMFYKRLGNNMVQCGVCFRGCTLKEGKRSFCRNKKNIKGRLYNLVYARPTAVHIDPIEKEPSLHMLPGTKILCFGTAGCNFRCKFCQNWTMSKARLDDLNALTVSPEDVVSLAKKHSTPSIAYTYNDPTIFAEYVFDISKLAREEGIRSVMVTAGYIDKEARKEVYRYIDAANVDLKAFSERFYYKLTSSHLNDVLDTLLWLKNETDVWIELTTLLIPGENDSQEEIKKECDWILENLGNSVPLHFTAFHPDF